MTTAALRLPPSTLQAPVRASAEAPSSGRATGGGAFWHVAASPVDAAGSMCAASCSPCSFVGVEDDPFCRPAAHDPLEGLPTPAVRLQPSPPPPLSGLPSGSPPASEGSPGSELSEAQLLPAAFGAIKAGAGGSGGAASCPGQAQPEEEVLEEPAPAAQPDVSAVLQQLEQGLAGLTSLAAGDGTALDAGNRQKLSGLLGGIATAGGHLTSALSSRAAAPAGAVDAGEQENAGCNPAAALPGMAAGMSAAAAQVGPTAVSPFCSASQQSTESSDLAAFKAEVWRELADMRRLLASRA